jgi:opacity protein-like surface antigen
MRLRSVVVALCAGAVLAIGLAGVAGAHVVVKAGTYSLAIGWAHEPTYVGEQNAVQVIVTTAAGRPVDDLKAGDLAVVVSTGGQQSTSLQLVPMYDADTGLGIHGDYEAALMPTAPGDYTFHVTGSVHGTTVDETETSSDSTFNSATDATGIQFPAKLPTMAEVTTRLDRVDARIAALPSPGPAADAAVADAKSAASQALLAGVAVGGAGVVLAIAALWLGLRGRRASAA